MQNKQGVWERLNLPSVKFKLGNDLNIWTYSTLQFHGQNIKIKNIKTWNL